MQKHEYFLEDTPSRKKYFEDHFFRLLRVYAKNNKITVGSLLMGIVDVDSIYDALLMVSGEDPSLMAYFEGMRDADIESFFKMPKIQEIVKENLKLYESESSKEIEKRTEDIEKLGQKISARTPTKIVQKKKKTRRFFQAKYIEKSTGKVRRTIAKKERVTVRGKRQTRYRNPSTGKFVKKVELK